MFPADSNLESPLKRPSNAFMEEWSVDGMTLVAAFPSGSQTLLNRESYG